MNRLNVVISLDLPDKYLKQIEEISGNIIVHTSSNEKELLDLIREANVLLAGKFSKSMFSAARNLKWIQTTGVGVDKFIFPEVLNSKVIITNPGDIFSTAISEHVIMFMLILSRKMNIFFLNQTRKQWNRYGGYLAGTFEELKGKTLGIIGLGNIGQELARKAKSLGMEVIATKRKPQSCKTCYVDELLPMNQLKELLSKSDFVVLTIPLTADTYGLIGEEEFNCMKKTAYFINVCRGKIVQEDKLLSALERGIIAGAALDTFEEEPLNQDSKLWSMENVIITPHMAGVSNSYIERLTNVFCKNLRLFLSNKALVNTVDKKEGY